MTYRADNLLVEPGGCSRPVHQPVAHGVVSPRTYGRKCPSWFRGDFGVLRRPYGVSSWSRKTKKSCFTTTTTLRQISYVGIYRIGTGTEKILSQFSFNNGTEHKALSLTVMITMTMTMTMNDDDDASNDDSDDNGGDNGDDGHNGNDDDDNGNNDGGGSDDGDSHDGGNDNKTTTRRRRDDDDDDHHDGDDDDDNDKRKVTTSRCAREAQ
jgi:hypothetical protein